MCNFLSAIVLREPRAKGGFTLLHSATTDSHSDLIAAHKLRDDGRLRFARVEYSPGDPEKVYLLETYGLKIDEERTPDWFGVEMKESVAARLAIIVKDMMVSKTGMTLLGGMWIIPPGLEALVGPMTRIVANYGTVNYNYGTVSYNSGTVNDNSGTVTKNYSGGTVTDK